ncbi:transcriptional regulator PpsR [Oceaniradius stylonematis]|uniref:transcriptional regulator PpsR n=1 Tax=Oceaniradius stylonematis TaxID=2184161 RepID=UPI003C7C3C98
MEKQVSRHNHRIFGRSARLFDQAGPEASAFLASVGADVSLLLSVEGDIIDVAYRDPSLERYGIDDWIGRAWRDTVTVECVDKIDALIEENAKTGTTRRRQVNHPASGMQDLPVDYTLLTVEGMPWRLALGEDMRKLSELQQQLVRTQAELETEYRKIRDAESRYRTIFHKTAQAIIVIDGESHAVIDINLTGANLLHQPAERIIDKPVLQLIEREDRAKLTDALNAARHGGTRQNLTLRAAGHPEPLLGVIEPYRESGRGNLMLSLVPAAAASAHAAPEGADTALLDSFPEALVLIDRKGMISIANDPFLDLIHVLNKSLVVDRNLNNWLGASSVDLQVLLSRVREEGQVRQFSTVIRDELGTTRTVAVSAARMSGDADDQRIGVFITEASRRDSQFAVPAPGVESGSSDFAELVGRVPLKDLIREAVDVIEKMCIEAALRQTDNNRASAADMLGLSRQSLYIKLRRHGLEDFGNASS